jgi:hypothetical protein
MLLTPHRIGLYKHLLNIVIVIVVFMMLAMM